MFIIEGLGKEDKEKEEVEGKKRGNWWIEFLEVEGNGMREYVGGEDVKYIEKWMRI